MTLKESEKALGLIKNEIENRFQSIILEYSINGIKARIEGKLVDIFLINLINDSFYLKVYCSNRIFNLFDFKTAINDFWVGFYN